MTSPHFHMEVVATATCSDPSEVQQAMEALSRVAAGLGLEGITVEVGIYHPHLHEHADEEDVTP